MSNLYDINGKPILANDDFVSLGSPGAGSDSNDPQKPGEDTSGRLLNVSPDPQLDILSTGDFINTDYTLHQQEQIFHLKEISAHIKKLAYQKVDYIRALPFRSATGIFRANIGTVAGFSLRETAGFALTVDFFDSLDGSNLMYLFSSQLAANGVDRLFVMPEGISFQQGLYIKLTGTGNAVGAVWFAEKG